MTKKRYDEELDSVFPTDLQCICAMIVIFIILLCLVGVGLDAYFSNQEIVVEDVV